MIEFLREEHVDEKIIQGIEDYRRQFPAPSGTPGWKPRYIYYGREVWEQAAQALLCGENLLLAGSKATGKNVLAENLAALFGRPSYNVSFHINMDASYMIGTDTFQNGEVVFRPGPVYDCAKLGGFCILDEINMARNEALAVLHSVLDFRRVINVPGYETIPVHRAARFIATMNYGYAGTRELNEALASRFMVIHMPEMTRENLEKLLTHEFPDMKKEYVQQFSGLFTDIQKKCQSGELTAKVLDLRGLLDAIRLIQNGLAPYLALDMGITNKTFDSYEQSLVKDIITSRISKKSGRDAIFC
ncbi:MAG TPA: MoxR family ATPase [Candidatus Mediterraneibacter cottocaccae]|nr:MoxR family ATPase [Candidatus Mediterraneibacter cottocaccae]